MARTTISFFVLFFFIGSISAATRPRIVGGHNAVIKHFPYLVSIRQLGRHTCGGTIISNRHILTAAHCVEDKTSFEYMTIHSGTSKKTNEGTVHEVLEVFSHPKYDKYDPLVYNDIAIITLQDPIVFNKYQQKINLPNHDVQSHQVGYVIGWGRDDRSNWHSPQQLQKLQVALLPSEKCQPFLPNKLRESQVCLFRRFGTGPCHGDSGGPLVSNGEVVGVASYVYRGDCASSIPTVYTNVFAFKDLIESVINA